MLLLLVVLLVLLLLRVLLLLLAERLVLHALLLHLLRVRDPVPQAGRLLLLLLLLLRLLLWLLLLRGWRRWRLPLLLRLQGREVLRPRVVVKMLRWGSRVVCLLLQGIRGRRVLLRRLGVARTPRMAAEMRRWWRWGTRCVSGLIRRSWGLDVCRRHLRRGSTLGLIARAVVVRTGRLCDGRPTGSDLGEVADGRLRRLRLMWCAIRHSLVRLQDRLFVWRPLPDDVLGLMR